MFMDLICFNNKFKQIHKQLLFMLVQFGVPIRCLISIY